MPAGIMPILKNARNAIIDERKVTAYVLSPTHPRGRDKARIFRSALGYDLANCGELIEQIRRAILKREAVFIRHDRYGRHYRSMPPSTDRVEPPAVRTPPRRRNIERFALFDVVRVRRAVPEHRLAGGEEGTIVEILDQPERAYLIDFSGATADPTRPGPARHRPYRRPVHAGLKPRLRRGMSSHRRE